jgi:methionine synthase II (cobalamin-independent)
MHVCWGNYEGPHHYDVPLADIVDIIFSGRPASISFEAANPRHAHEWALFETVKLPEGKIVIPGVIESKSNAKSPQQQRVSESPRAPKTGLGAAGNYTRVCHMRTGIDWVEISFW